MAKGKTTSKQIRAKKDWRDTSTAKDKPQKQIHSPVSVSFKHFDHGGHHCFQHCNNDELRQVMDCLRQLTIMSWLQVRNTGGKRGKKTGLGFTPYGDGDLNGVNRPATLSSDLQIVGVRGTDKMRVYGAHSDGVFYLLWFDRNHQIVPSD